tara:strand:+ start:1373 stop:1513 length:141 start_codon:yes stop_codon:yes gene_type:complete
MPKKTIVKPVSTNHIPNGPLQYKVVKSVEKNSKLKPKDVFDFKKKT